jgi:CDP-diacylglycerol--glycerol-3-phosphate 3-phosphatidyltransferase
MSAPADPPGGPTGETPQPAATTPVDPGPRSRGKRRLRAPLAPRRSIREDAINLPNLLTMLRVAVIPLVLWLIYVGTPATNYWAAWVYAGAAVTDALDGYLARKRGLVSVLGKFLDPLADKLLVMAVLVVMTDMGRVPAWATVVVVARELSITALRTIAVSEGVVIAAGEGGKQKAALQMVAMLFLILHHAYEMDFFVARLRVDLHEVGMVLLYASIFFAVTSAGEYVKLFVDAVEAKERRLEEQRKRREERLSNPPATRGPVKGRAD